MHIAVLLEYPTLLGGERSWLAAVDELRRQSLPFHFTALAPPVGPLADALAERDIPHVPWSVRDSAGERRPADELATELVQLLRPLRPDLVHANSLSMGRSLGRVAARLACPTSAHVRDILRLSAAAIADLNRITRWIAVSEATRTHHVSQGLEADRIVTIHNGIDLEEFRPREPTGRIHRELEIPSGVPMLAAIGQIGLRKGWDVLAEANSFLPRDLGVIHLLLIGARHSGKAESLLFEEQLQQQFRSACGGFHVHWLGVRTDVASLLSEIDLLVHPARQEPLGRVLIEALAAGVPIVATDVGGTREIVEPDVSGLLVPGGDPVGLASCITTLLTIPGVADGLRVQARLRATRHFDIRQSAARLAACWQSLAAT